VFSTNRDVDPVGACVGMRGSRVLNVVQELRGEKIDIIPWTQDQARYVCNALAPAKISRVYIDEENRHMEVVVPDDQLSLAIGKKGQNVRLASKLTGWKIDIKSESKMEKISMEIIEKFKELPYLGDVTARLLYNEGFRSIKEIAEADPEELLRILEFEKAKVIEIIETARKKVENEGIKDSELQDDPALDPLTEVKGIGEKTAEILLANGYQTIKDILEEDVEKLLKIPGIGEKKAEKLLEAARLYIEQKKR
jgi:N utilization substance protein A